MHEHVDASQTSGKIGLEIVHNIIRYDLKGKLFPVNPNAEFVHSIKSYTNVRQIEDELDLRYTASRIPHLFDFYRTVDYHSMFS